METLDILEEITLLPVNQRIRLAEKIIGSVRKEEQKITMQNTTPKEAVSKAEKEKKHAAFNRLIGLTADNPISLEEAREERLSR
ncbi:hypothetical protein AGMMS49944_07260 [Spirochaetia bacterium]|nr:hypothetical protein AGMMS49944_07260 [Spirochaetia bacterium]